MTINVDSIISTVAGVIEPSGDRLDFTGMYLTDTSSMPTLSMMQFSTLEEVSNFYGVGSQEAGAAVNYFLGFDNSTRKPANIKFYRHVGSDATAYVTSGTMKGVSLADLQAVNGDMTITIDAETQTTAAFNLNNATSFSNAATLIEDELNLVFTLTASVTYNPNKQAFIITSPTTGTSSIVGFSVGSIVDGLKLSALTGATRSMGVNAQTLTETLNEIALTYRNWVSLVSVLDLSLGERLEIAVWMNSHNDDFLYIAHDKDINALNPLNTSDLGSLLIANTYSGTAVVFGDISHSSFMAGMIASIDTGRDNGWITLAYKSQKSLSPTVSDTTEANTLEAKKYNFYGNWASRSQNKNMLMHGAIAGRWDWVDDYLGQIYLRSGFQESSLSLLSQIRRLPYNLESYDILKSVWVGDVINSALDIGIIATGIALDSTQRILIDSLTGVDGSGDIVSSVGWFLDISSPAAAVRVARESPVIVFVYTSGQSIHRLHIPVFLAQ